MADADTKIADAPLASNAVPLPANSFYVHELQAQLDAAAKSPEAERARAIDEAIVATAARPDELTEVGRGSIPPGHEMRTIEGEDGSTVTTPLFIPAEKRVDDMDRDELFAEAERLELSPKANASKATLQKLVSDELARADEAGRLDQKTATEVVAGDTTTDNEAGLNTSDVAV